MSKEAQYGQPKSLYEHTLMMEQLTNILMDKLVDKLEPDEEQLLTQLTTGLNDLAQGVMQLEELAPKASKKEAQVNWEDMEDDEGISDLEVMEQYDPMEEEDEPQEDDIFLQPTGTLRGGTSVSAEGKWLGDFEDDVEAIEFIKLWMEENKYWPNVWMVSDHGNIHGPIDVNE